MSQCLVKLGLVQGKRCTEKLCDCKALGPQDHAVIMGCANDISMNETKNCINTLKSTLSALTSTNVAVLNIPSRHDLVKESIVNKEIRKANIDRITNLTRPPNLITVVNQRSREISY
jgi:hypothetical protein